MRSHFPITIDRFRGIYYKGYWQGGVGLSYTHNYDCPSDHAIRAENVEFVGYQDVQSRKSFNMQTGVVGLTGTPVRVWEYRQNPTTTFYLTWTWDGANGRLYDPTGPTLLLGPLTGASDFSIAVMYGRCYISPHDRSFGTDYLYVWDGVNAVRKAALDNIGFIGGLTPANGAAGNIEVGDHILMVAFESQSGFIGNPHSASIFTAPGNVMCNVTTIPLGPPGTVARHLLFSKVVFGNTQSQVTSAELFYLPGTMGKINDNVTAFKNNINFYDSELIRSADYLKDQFQEIPSGVAVGTYGTRLVVVGATKAVKGPFAVGNITPTSNQAWISRPGEPEAIDATDGFVQISDKSYGGIKNLCALNGNLYLYRDSATSSTRDNGDSPSTWGIETVDGGLGAGCFGVATITSGLESTSDVAVVATRDGLFLFNGSYAQIPISWKVSGLWEGILRDGTIIDFYKLQVAVVPGIKSIFITRLPMDASYGDPYCWIMRCDYQRGFGFEDVEWTTWSIAQGDTIQTSQSVLSIASEISYDGGITSTRSSILVLAFNSVDGLYNIFRALGGSDGADVSGNFLINWNYRLSYTEPDEESNIQHFTGIRTYQSCTIGAPPGTVLVAGVVIGFATGGTVFNITDEVMGSADFKSRTYPFNQQGERISIQFKALATKFSGIWRLSRLVIFGKTQWKDVPK